MQCMALKGHSSQKIFVAIVLLMLVKIQKTANSFANNSVKFREHTHTHTGEVINNGGVNSRLAATQ